MSSAFDDLLRRERKKLDFLTSPAESILAPMREQERLLNSIMSPSIRSALEMLEKCGAILGRADSTAKLIEQATGINALLASQRRAYEDFATLSTTRVADQIRDLVAPRFADQLKAVIAPAFLADFRNVLADSAAASLRGVGVADFEALALSSTAQIARFMQDATKPAGITGVLSDFVSEAEKIASRNAFVTPEGIRVDSDLVAAADLTAHLREAMAFASEAPRAERLREFFSECLRLLRRAPKPVAKALGSLLLAIVATILAGEVQEISKDLLAPARQKLLARIRKLTGLQRKTPKSERIRMPNFRVITARHTLHVRAYPRTSDSRIVGSLELGAVVVYVREVKDWTLIEYQEGDAIVEGWVYTRYARKVVLPANSVLPTDACDDGDCE